MTFRPILAGLLATLAVLAVPHRVGAQGIGLPPAILQAAQPNPEQVKAIEAWAKEHGELLTTEPVNGGKFKAARRAAIEPFGNPQITVNSRTEITKALMPYLERMAAAGKPDSIIRLINSINIAGRFATAGGVDFAERFRNHDDATVRYAEGYAIARTFEAIRIGSPAIVPARIETMLATLREQLEKEQDPRVVDAVVRAFMAAATQAAAQDGFQAIRPLAYRTLAETSSDRLAALQPGKNQGAMLEAFLRAGNAVREALTNAANPPGPDVAKVGAELGGRSIAAVLRLLPDFPPAGAGDAPAVAQSRTTPSQLAQVGEQLIIFAGERLGGAPVQPERLGDHLKQATANGDTAFNAGARRLVGPGGVLTKTPFSFAADHFIK